MKKRFTILSLSVLFSAFFTGTASAHTGMAEYSIVHIGLHIIASVGIYIALMLAGLYLLKRLPKAKKVRIKNDKK